MYSAGLFQYLKRATYRIEKERCDLAHFTEFGYLKRQFVEIFNSIVNENSNLNFLFKTLDLWESAFAF